jgi:transcriptional antiterminator NusG
MSSVMTEAQWYAIQARSNFENRMCKDLEVRGVESYCPAIREVHQWADRKKIVDRPVFPGYVLARFPDLAEFRLRVLQSAGAVRILGKSGKIEPIPEVEIDSIRKTLDSGRPCALHPFLKEGAQVRVRRGALRNAEGILVRTKNDARLVVSISLFSRSIATEVDLRDIEVLRPAPMEHSSLYS